MIFLLEGAMNRKVLKVMIGLVVAFLVTDYILKIFFPEQFAMSITNPKFVAIGEFIDERQWLVDICDAITSFLTYWLYICAVTRKWTLSFKEFLLVCLAIALNYFAYMYDVNLAVAISVTAMIGIPAISGAQLKDVAIVYCIHQFAQMLSISIRNFPMYLTDINTITGFFMMIEGYFWLLLFYFLYNYKEDEKWERKCHHIME